MPRLPEDFELLTEATQQIIPPIPPMSQVPPVPQDTAVEGPTLDVPTSIQDLIGGKLAEAETRKPRQRTARSRDGSTNYEAREESESSSYGSDATGRGQRKRSKRIVNDDRLYDGSQLHANHHGYFVHRDYAAHFFRWGFVSRYIKQGFRVLDVGCGQDLPLARVLSAPNIYKNCEPEIVTAVDWNPISSTFRPKWLTVLEQFDFCNRWGELVGSFLPDNTWVSMPQYQFDIIVNLEVIEHMDVPSGDRMLQGFLGCLKPGGRVIISTPIFNGLAAANHIHEYRARELYDKFIQNGFTPVARFGTFANLKDLEKVCTAQEQQLVEELKQFYGGDVISCFLAPKYPQAARNNCWVLARTIDVGPLNLMQIVPPEYTSEELQAQLTLQIPDVPDVPQVPGMMVIPERVPEMPYEPPQVVTLDDINAALEMEEGDGSVE